MTEVNEVAFGPRFAAVWIGLCLLAAVGGWLAGAPGPYAIAALVTMSLPAWAALAQPALAKRDSIWPVAGQVLAWTVIALLAVVASGGALSPLVVLFLIGPLVGLAAGQGRMALEAAAFGVLAYVFLLVLQALAGPAPKLPAMASLELSFALAGLAAAGWLIWQVMQDLAEARQALTAAAPAANLPRRQKAPAWVPETAPVLIVELTRHGRVTRLLGDVTLAPQLRPGQLAEYGFGQGAETAVARLIRETGSVRLARSGGPDLDLHVRFGETDGVLLALPASISQDEIFRLRSESDAALAERTAFFASLGHELKTPLNAIIGFSDMMRNGLRGALQPPYDEYSGIIHDSAQDLLLLVEDILDLARSETGRQTFEPEPVDLVESGQAVMRQLEPQADRSEVEMRMLATGPVWAMADARAVRQVWQNLLSNAIKYSERCGVIRLDAREADADVWLSVEDEGAGMDQGDLDRIATPFAQGENARGRAGTGLGLAVVKRFADQHGGKVRIDTKPGEGTRVRVTFPAADGPEAFGEVENAAE